LTASSSSRTKKAASGEKRDLNALLRKGDTWQVETDAETSTSSGRLQ